MTQREAPKFRHPSGVSLDPHGRDAIPQKLDIDVTDSLTDDAQGCLTSLGLHVARFRRSSADTWARAAVTLLNDWYAAKGIPRIAAYDKHSGEITTRNSIV